MTPWEDSRPPAPPPVVIPAECGLDPVEPEPVDPVTLPALPPAPGATAAVVEIVNYWRTRGQRAELAGLHFMGERNAFRAAWETNAATQRVCAAWARDPGARMELAGGER